MDRISHRTAAGFAVNDDAPIEDDPTSGADVEITDVTQLVEQFVLREHKQQQRVSDAKAQVRIGLTFICLTCWGSRASAAHAKQPALYFVERTSNTANINCCVCCV